MRLLTRERKGGAARNHGKPFGGQRTDTMRTKQLRVLVTGHTGYIGSVMAPILRKAGHEVVGMDTGYFNRCTFFEGDDSIPSIERDIREVERRDLEGFDAVVHLAALSNDPLGDLNERW